uniref:J domain-containing protein n=1 Tax=viral metagenome TaxID=1070528 RepID=A0A6C0EVR5_9ZZZZ
MSKKVEKVDLNIDNYQLDDVLNLFRIPVDFDETDLKRAKQIVLKTHPDKSNLDPEYFRFYSKAYKMLYTIWEFRKRGDIDNDNKNTEYSNDIADEEKRVLLDKFFETNSKLKSNKSKDFNKWFNEQFDKNKLYNEGEQKGYENWLRSDEDMDTTSTNVTMSTMAQEFDKKKSQMRSLIVREEVMDFSSRSMNGCDLSTDAPGSFNSDMFSSLPYQDLHQAHTESVIPVTDEDYENKQKFNNVNEFVSYRNTQDTKPLSEMQALEYLNNRNKKDDEMATSRAYQLAKQTELSRQKNNEFWSGLMLLHNK